MSNNKINIIRPLWIEINLKALKNNFKLIRNIIQKNVKIMAVVKQHAYGCGLLEVAKELSCLGVDYFGVGSVEEGIILRENNFKEPILVLTSVLANFTNYFVRYRLVPTVVSLDFAKKLNKEALKRNIRVPIHIKIDTGMGRLGPSFKDAYKFVKEVSKLKNLFLEGIFTHFPAADTDFEFTNYQIEIFNNLVSKLEEEKIYFKYKHCANSMGLLNYPNAHFNLVRPGILLYGVKPSPNLELKLRPILSLKSRIVFIKKVSTNTSISYARTYITKKSTLIATVAIGYADGYPWCVSNKSRVIIKDSFFNIVGRVCMDHVMVDLGERNDIKIGEEVIIIGTKNNLSITVEELASISQTIPYEIISRLSLKIPRIYKR